MDAQLCEKKKISQCNGARILSGKCQSTVCGFLTVHTNNNDITIDLYMIFWFYFTYIKVSPRQTSCSLASTLNLMCAYDVTCSYDVIMRK